MSTDLNDSQHYFDLGNARQAQGKRDEAVFNYREALSRKPDFVEARANLGVALQALGQLDEAVDCYYKVLSARPGFAEVHFNLGNALKDQGRVDDAIASYRTAISLKPDFAEAHNNLGVALCTNGKLDEAIASCRQALSLKPDYAEAHNNLGNALDANGQIEAAISSYARAVELNEVPAYRINFVRCIKNHDFARADAAIRQLVVRAVSEQWGWQSELTRAGVNLVLCDRTIRDCVERSMLAWPKRLSGDQLLAGHELALVANDVLLRALLVNGPIGDVPMERFLTMVRHSMLDAAMPPDVGEGLGDDMLAFYCAVAQQCFINEYVYALDDAELGQAANLREKLLAALQTGADVPAPWIAAVAAYWPLSSIPSAGILVDRTWPEAVRALLVQQVVEPLEERGYRDVIPRLTDVGANVSTAVRQQYEENPYPRWIKAPPPETAFPFDDYLRVTFPNASFVPLGKRDEIEMLIAGCGTGLEPILRARQFEKINLLAVDLSLSSICYAKRKTRETGMENIEYGQADITKLKSLGRTFDVVESVGVLHHLADPVGGLRTLLSLLRPGGFMCLGFYSEYAREVVVEAKAVIAKEGYAATDMDIRRCRQDLLLGKYGKQFERLTTIRDFFVMSECRDLLFHVQEHRFTLPQIKELLEGFGLKFIGFASMDPNVLKDYEARFADDKAHVNLDYWGYFETEFRNTFMGMYVFWVQKPALQ